MVQSEVAKYCPTQLLLDTRAGTVNEYGQTHLQLATEYGQNDILLLDKGTRPHKVKYEVIFSGSGRRKIIIATRNVTTQAAINENKLLISLRSPTLFRYYVDKLVQSFGQRQLNLFAL